MCEEFAGAGTVRRGVRASARVLCGRGSFVFVAVPLTMRGKASSLPTRVGGMGGIATRRSLVTVRGYYVSAGGVVCVCVGW